MEFFKVNANPVYGILNPIGLKYLTRLRVGLSHLRVHKYEHNFRDTPSKFCFCHSRDEETVEHFLLHCPSYLPMRSKVFGKLKISRFKNLFCHN